MLKKYAFFIAGVFSFSAPSLAQVSVFPKAGVSFGTYRINDVNDKDHVLGAAAGIGANIGLAGSTVFSLQPEILFIQKGYHYRQRTTTDTPIGSFSINTDSRATHNYAEVPLLLKAALGTSRTRYYVVAGPSAGFGLGGNYTSRIRTDSDYNFDREGKVFFKNKPAHYTGQDAYLYPRGYNRVDWGAQIGMGVGLSVGKGVLLADARYGVGLNHLVKRHTKYITVSNPGLGDGEVGFNVPANMKSRTLVLSLGYMVPLGNPM